MSDTFRAVKENVLKKYGWSLAIAVMAYVWVDKERDLSALDTRQRTLIEQVVELRAGLKAANEKLDLLLGKGGR